MFSAQIGVHESEKSIRNAIYVWQNKTENKRNKKTNLKSNNTYNIVQCFQVSFINRSLCSDKMNRLVNGYFIFGAIYFKQNYRRTQGTLYLPHLLFPNFVYCCF